MWSQPQPWLQSDLICQWLTHLAFLKDSVVERPKPGANDSTVTMTKCRACAYHEGIVKSNLSCMPQEAEEQLDEGKVGFIPEASALTHKQVLEMAVAEASRRVHEATKYAVLSHTV